VAATYRTIFTGGATSGTVDRSLTFTPAVGDALIAFAAVSQNSNASPTLTDNQGGTWTVVATALKGSSSDILLAAVRNTAVASAVSHTLTFGTGSNTAAALAVVAVSGALSFGANLVRQSASTANQTSATTPSVTFSSSVLTGNMTIVALFDTANPATATPPTGWTERADIGQSTPNTGLEVATRDSGFTSTTVTWGAAVASNWSAIGLELTQDAVISLVGHSMTSSQGTLTSGVGLSLSGLAVASSQGTVAASSIGPITWHRRGGIGVNAVGAHPIATPVDTAVTTNIALSGLALASSQGTLASAASFTLTGLTAVSSSGSLLPTVASGLAGNALASVVGTLLPGASNELSGLAIASARGTLSVEGGEQTIVLTGLTVAAAEGVVTPSVAQPFLGLSLTFHQGAPVPAAAQAFSGLAVASSRGTVVPAVGPALSGLSIATSRGTVVPAVSLSLSSQAIASSRGTITTTISVPHNPSRMWFIF
jgi:hypothetical protein